MDYEELHKQLSKIENKDYAKETVAKIQKLPKPLQQLGYCAFGRNADGKPLRHNWEKIEKMKREVAAQMTGTTKAQRKKIFAQMFPRLADEVEMAWNFAGGTNNSEYGEASALAADDENAQQGNRVEWLVDFTNAFGSYNPDVDWLWEWSAHLWNKDSASILLAAVIDGGGKSGAALFEKCYGDLAGDRGPDGFSSASLRTLMLASKPEGWEIVEKTLLAAQRQEGVRESILSELPVAHPEAFKRMIRLIIDEKLVRFSSVVQAINQLVSYNWDSVSAGVVNQTLEHLSDFLENPDHRLAAIRGDEPEPIYLALWCEAYGDTESAAKLAREVYERGNAEQRFAAVSIAEELPGEEAKSLIVEVLKDEDYRIAAKAVHKCQHQHEVWPVSKDVIFDLLEKLLARMPAKRTELNPLIWPWTKLTTDRQLVGSAMAQNCDDPVRLIPYFKAIPGYERALVARKLGRTKTWTPEIRRTIFAMLGDTEGGVRDAAVKSLKNKKIHPEEAEGMEKLLTRKTAELRRGILQLLVALADKDAFASAQRLTEARNENQRLAGLEMLLELKKADRLTEQCQSSATAYEAQAKKLTAAEETALAQILEEESEEISAADAFGLLRDEKRSVGTAPKKQKVKLNSDTTASLLQSLDDFIHQHREEPVKVVNWEGTLEDSLLGKICAEGPFPHPGVEDDDEEESNKVKEPPTMPQRDLFEQWDRERPAKTRDSDGFEFLRALAALTWSEDSEWHRDIRKRCPKESENLFGTAKVPRLKYRQNIDSILAWLMSFSPPKGLFEFVFQASEHCLACVPASEIENTRKYSSYNKTAWRDCNSPFYIWTQMIERVRVWKKMDDRYYQKYWELLCWIDRPIGFEKHKVPRAQPGIAITAYAWGLGIATDGDVIDELLPDLSHENYTRYYSFGEMTSRSYGGVEDAKFRALVDRCRDRVLEIELKRSEKPTPATQAASSIATVWGTERFIQILRSIGKRPFSRGYTYGRDENREVVFSGLLRACLPGPDDTPESFAKLVKETDLTEQRLIEAAMYAPQWADHVEAAVGWKDFAQGIWWIHAHTKDRNWDVDQSLRESWAARWAELTSLSPDDLADGAVDVDWFQRIYATLGKNKWAVLDDAAKYAAAGTGHARARMFSSAMLNQLKPKDLEKRINDKRNQDALRALGLVPLPKGKQREKQVLKRFLVIQEFLRGSRQFGSQRQASEKRAAQIAQANLARTAGYADPIRLQWAMEARAVADLSDGPIVIERDETRVSLEVNQWGEISLTVLKAGKELANVPAKLNKDKEIKALKARRTELKRQASRIRKSLEYFMVKGDTFTGTELVELMKHPLLGPMLSGLVLVGDGIAGFPIHGGKALVNHSGNTDPVKPTEDVRIAHPHDLLPAKEWTKWQRDCFASERIQPFKQVFREYYALSKQEKGKTTRSERYSGHQLQPRKAMAVLGTRGWVNDPDFGVRKTFHEENLNAWIEFMEPFFTPAEVEGLTLEAVFFTPRGECKPVQLSKLPPRLFSEAMRDLDLVVSVAHRGEIDPEASQSTVEVRAAIVSETTRTLGLKNVRVKNNHALIKGTMGEYTVHLGSAMIQKMPGQSVIIVPVHSAHRGRIFLPFADEDPKTAELMSKVLLLARDEEIKDPNIIDQLR